MSDKDDLRTSMQCNLTLSMSSRQIDLTSKEGLSHLEKIQREAIFWARGLRDLAVKERFKVLKLQCLEKEDGK